ncbi:MAG: anthrone oxygenase family protein [Chitinophagaceae bacterium]
MKKTMNSKSAKMTNPTILLLITALLTALITGLFYAYSCSINPGLGRLPDQEYLAAMQSINKAILNPVFFASFMGTLILLPISTWLHYGQPDSSRFILLLIATLFYAIGTFGVTMFGNVPLNDTLANFDLKSASPESILTQRKNFEARWNNLHTIRTLASLVSLVLVLIACLTPPVKNITE